MLVYKDLIPISNGSDLRFVPLQSEIIDRNRLIWSSRVQLSNIANLFLKLMRKSIKKEN
ncbi:hypothetical protein [Lactobacillus taiwanensis]|uniref:hypothetical protein n=1 Tax=Lactobacillus taiwanensis TaxID=508451 RepID=UPI00260E5B56|nr:hypothetical protein [Lactobacillus taiwanensis]